jgi:hypothetical protein
LPCKLLSRLAILNLSVFFFLDFICSIGS